MCDNKKNSPDSFVLINLQILLFRPNYENKHEAKFWGLKNESEAMWHGYIAFKNRETS